MVWQKKFLNENVLNALLNNETYDVTDDGVRELTTVLREKAKILRIFLGYVCSDFET